MRLVSQELRIWKILQLAYLGKYLWYTRFLPKPANQPTDTNLMLVVLLAPPESLISPCNSSCIESESLKQFHSKTFPFFWIKFIFKLIWSKIFQTTLKWWHVSFQLDPSKPYTTHNLNFIYFFDKTQQTNFNHSWCGI